MQYLKLVLAHLLTLSSALLQITKTVLTISTQLLKKFNYSFFCSLLMSSTAILTEMKSDSLHYLAVLSLLTHWHLHLLYIQSMFCSRASCISCHWLFYLFVKESCLFYSHFYLHFQIFKVLVCVKQQKVADLKHVFLTLKFNWIFLW